MSRTNVSLLENPIILVQDISKHGILEGLENSNVINLSLTRLLNWLSFKHIHSLLFSRDDN